jgi:hypothetical protein
MAAQIETTKLNLYGLVGTASSEVSVPKLNMYALLEPGESGPDTSGRQGHVHTQILRRS